MSFDVAPSTFSEDDFNAVMVPYINLAEGLGIVLARLPDENGWDQSTFFDHDAGQIITNAAIEHLKWYGKSNKLFYNTEKLEDAATQTLIAAYGNAYIAEKGKREENVGRVA